MNTLDIRRPLRDTTPLDLLATMGPEAASIVTELHRLADGTKDDHRRLSRALTDWLEALLGQGHDDPIRFTCRVLDKRVESGPLDELFEAAFHETFDCEVELGCACVFAVGVLDDIGWSGMVNSSTELWDVWFSTYVSLLSCLWNLSDETPAAFFSRLNRSLSPNLPAERIDTAAHAAFRRFRSEHAMGADTETLDALAAAEWPPGFVPTGDDFERLILSRKGLVSPPAQAFDHLEGGPADAAPTRSLPPAREPALAYPERPQPPYGKTTLTDMLEMYFSAALTFVREVEATKMAPKGDAA